VRSAKTVLRPVYIPEADPICWGLNEDGCPVVSIPNCITGDPLVIGAVQTVSGNVVDNADPKNPVITAVASVTGDGVDNTDPQNPVVNVPPASALIQDEGTGVITHTAGDGTESTAETKHSTTVPEPDGFHTITTDDGVSTQVCLAPVKTINGVVPDITGNVNVADLLSTTTDNGDGTFTTVNADGTPVTWSGDTFASGADNGNGTATITFSDASTLTFCLNPVKSVVQNEDGLGATVTLADGTIGQLAYPTSSFSSNGNGVGTHDDGLGDTFALQEPLSDGGSSLLGADGVTINPLLGKDNAPIDVLAERLLKLSDNLIANIECIDGDMIATRCDGSAVCFGSSTIIDRAGYSQADNVAVDENTAAGTVVTPEDACVSYSTGKLRQFIRYRGYMSFTVVNDSGQQVNPAGFVNFNMEMAINGGNWSLLASGGVDQLVLGGNEFSNGQYGEIAFSNERFLNRPANAEETVCFRIVVTDNTLNTGVGENFRIAANAANFYVEHDEMTCTEIPAP